MGYNVLDAIKKPLGNVDYAHDAVDSAISAEIGKTGVPEKGGLIPGMESEIADRDAYRADFTTERERILGQYDINRAGQQGINELALGELPGLAGASTPGGYTDRVNALAGDPTMQRIIDRQNAQRQRAAGAAGAAAGLSRSGAAYQAAADATQTYDEFAMDKEQLLYDRSNQNLDRYRDLPIAGQMVLDTQARDFSIADNLIAQGLSRSQGELLKGQIQDNSIETLLGTLGDVYGALTADGSGSFEGLEDILGDVLGKVGEIIGGDDGWISGAVGGILGGILGTSGGGGGNSGGGGTPDFNPSVGGTVAEQMADWWEKAGAGSNKPDDRQEGDTYTANADGTRTNDRTGEVIEGVPGAVAGEQTYEDGDRVGVGEGTSGGASGGETSTTTPTTELPSITVPDPVIPEIPAPPITEPTFPALPPPTGPDDIIHTGEGDQPGTAAKPDYTSAAWKEGIGKALEAAVEAGELIVNRETGALEKPNKIEGTPEGVISGEGGNSVLSPTLMKEINAINDRFKASENLPSADSGEPLEPGQKRYSRTSAINAIKAALRNAGITDPNKQLRTFNPGSNNDSFVNFGIANASIYDMRLSSGAGQGHNNELGEEVFGGESTGGSLIKDEILPIVKDIAERYIKSQLPGIDVIAGGYDN